MSVTYARIGFTIRRIGINLLILLVLSPVWIILDNIVRKIVIKSLFGADVTRQMHWYDSPIQGWYSIASSLIYIGLIQQVALSFALHFIPTAWSPTRRRTIAVLGAPLALWPFNLQWIPRAFGMHLGTTEYVFLNMITVLPLIGMALAYGFLMRLPVEPLSLDARERTKIEIGTENHGKIISGRDTAIGVLIGVLMAVIILLTEYTSLGVSIMPDLLGLPGHFVGSISALIGGHLIVVLVCEILIVGRLVDKGKRAE
jgi:hypothetical protein